MKNPAESVHAFGGICFCIGRSKNLPDRSVGDQYKPMIFHQPIPTANVMSTLVVTRMKLIL